MWPFLYVCALSAQDFFAWRWRASLTVHLQQIYCANIGATCTRSKAPLMQVCQLQLHASINQRVQGSSGGSGWQGDKSSKLRCTPAYRVHGARLLTKLETPTHPPCLPTATLPRLSCVVHPSSPWTALTSAWLRTSPC